MAAHQFAAEVKSNAAYLLNHLDEVTLPGEVEPELKSLCLEMMALEERIRHAMVS